MPVNLAPLLETYSQDELAIEASALACERDLARFYKEAWPCFDPAPFLGNWHIDAIADHLMAVTDGEIKNLLINVPFRTGKTTLVSVSYPAWTWAQRKIGPRKGPQVTFLGASYASNLAEEISLVHNRLVKHPWYLARWGHRFTINKDQDSREHFTNSRKGGRISIGLQGGTPGRGATIKIFDDPHKVQDVESDDTRDSQIAIYDEGFSTRFTDPAESAEIVVMQRLAENDLSGHILEKFRDAGTWTHLMLPMEYDPQRHCVTVLKWGEPDDESGEAEAEIEWEDPRRYDAETGEERTDEESDGELLWEARFPRSIVQDLKSKLGPYACNPGEAPVLMADLSLKPISEIHVDDQVVGFHKKERGDNIKGRLKLAIARVNTIHTRIAPVVKVTLDSGEVIRCTRDHRWFRRDRASEDRDLYGSIVLGRTKLARVCPARLPTLNAEDQRLAGWLGGFFDGEGSVSLCRKSPHATRANYRASSSITFYQGAGRNLPLCQKLEAALRRFGFEFTTYEDDRKDNKTAACYGYRQYRLRGNDLPMYQRFLHIVQPTKWRDRIKDAAFGANFIKGREKVVSIEPDGEETVYALETTTGNYVVWGIASSNSAGQLQQSPEGRGGNIIRRDWWIPWRSKVFPDFGTVVLSLDTAYKKGEDNSYNAITVWGAFAGDKGRPKLMLKDAWRARCTLAELVDMTAALGRKHKADYLLIEDKSRGQDVNDEIKRLHGTMTWVVYLLPVASDKIGRAVSVQPMWSGDAHFDEATGMTSWPGGVIYAPQPPDPGKGELDWVEMVIDEAAKFPKASFDDLVDSCVQAVWWFRRNGVILRKDEFDEEEERARTFKPAPKPIYDV